MNLKNLLTLSAILLVAPSYISAQELTLQPSSVLWLSGDSTLHPYESTATVMELTAALEPGRSSALKSLALRIPVAGLKSDSGTMDKNMRKALKEVAAPAIMFEMTGYEAASAEGDGSLATVRGRLTIAGVPKDETVQGTLRREGGALRVAGTKELKMSDFGIAPPRMFMGTLKVKDQVVIHFDLTLTVKEK